MPSNSAPPSDANAAMGTVVALDPLGERRRPGRPRSIARAPDEQQLAQHQRVAERLQYHVEADPVVRAVSIEPDRTSTVALDAAMMEIAREAAGLLWERRQAQVRGRPEAQKISRRRTDALGRLANLVLERARLGGSELDPFDPKLQRLVSLFNEQAREVALEAIQPEHATRFIELYLSRIDGWESHV
jgi:hypothetical protein